MVKQSGNRTTLVCTLGTTAPVISETLDALTNGGRRIDKLVIVHTNFKDVFEKKTPSGKDIGLRAFENYMKKHSRYKHISLEFLNLKIADILTERDNEHLLRTMLEVFARERREGNTVYLSIAGGRKTMSAIALFAAYLIGCDGIFHVLVKGDEFEVTDKYGFNVPRDLLSLVEIPVINLSPVLRTILLAIDPGNRFGGDFHNYLSAGGDVKTVFQRCNAELLKTVNQQKLKEGYDRRRDQYEKMCFVVDSILQARAKEAGIMLRPERERRVKTFESLVEKIARKQAEGKVISDPFEDIEDIAGVRIICYFSKDVEEIGKIIKSGQDFSVHEIVEIKSTSIKKTKIVRDAQGQERERSEEKRTAHVGYSATHYIVTLTEDRTKLPEYKDLKGIKCEIQVKTIFDHAWSQVEHRLRYKSDEYQQMEQETKDRVDNVFTAANVLLNETKSEFSKLRALYSRQNLSKRKHRQRKPSC